mgnify:CR=1 FL=1|tara:strand:+ start:14509 stop:15849 length:1341 start_codon:yes stop_codon:yes gene_type:complete
MEMNNLNADSKRLDVSKIFFKEDFLHYLWKFKLFNIHKTQTIYNQEISIISGGTHNHNEGPDFLNAQLNIDKQLWAGNVEIHLTSSDWYVHKHEKDPNYDAVVLHVVWEYDIPVFFKDGTELPTVQLKDFVEPSILKAYYELFSGVQKWILCEDSIGETAPFVMKSWLNRLYFERLEVKSKQIFKMLEASANDWEAVLFHLLSKSFGMNLNGGAFLSLSASFNFSVLRKCQYKKGVLENLLFGQAGFLEDTIEDVCYIQMQKEFEFLKKKFQLLPLSKQQFLFFRLRPPNFPTLRISQLATLYERHMNLFSKVIERSELEDFYKLFSVTTSDYWQTHYVFGKETKKRVNKTSKSFIDVLLLNAILPLKYAYMRHHNKVDFEILEEMLQKIKPEKNSIIETFQVKGVKIKSAFDSQALLQMKHFYCDQKKCLQCGIGLELLKPTLKK